VETINAKLEQPPADIPNITQMVYADPATKPHRQSAHARLHTPPLTVFELLAK
jgi:hypothetical protein